MNGRKGKVDKPTCKALSGLHHGRLANTRDTLRLIGQKISTGSVESSYSLSTPLLSPNKPEYCEAGSQGPPGTVCHHRLYIETCSHGKPHRGSRAVPERWGEQAGEPGGLVAFPAAWPPFPLLRMEACLSGSEVGEPSQLGA